MQQILQMYLSLQTLSESIFDFTKQQQAQAKWAEFWAYSFENSASFALFTTQVT